MTTPARRPRKAAAVPFVAASYALSIAAVAPVSAQAPASDAAVLPSAIDEVVVKGVVYRNRAETVAPVLAYDLDYFQRFEPLTVGDMLKRTPSVAFLSDVLEYDGVRLRGLDPAYSQILINGKKVPGSGADRSFWVDRIPAELVRLTVSNLLDAEKKETIFEYDGGSADEIMTAMRANDIDEIERETERAGPIVQLIVRAAF